MKNTVAIFLASTAICVPAYAATLSGNAFFAPRANDGDLLNVGRVDSGGAGSAVLDSSRTFLSGTSPDELQARPKIDVGEGQTGLVVIEGTDTVIDLIGTNTGSGLEIGDEPGGDGTVIIREGATVRLTGDDGDPQDNNVLVQFGANGGTGEVTVDDANLIMDGYDQVGILAGSTQGSMGTFNVVNGADVQVIHRGPRTVIQDSAYIFVGNGGFNGEIGASTGEWLVDDSTVSFESEEGYTNIRVGRNGGSGETTVTNNAIVALDGGVGSFVIVGANNGSNGRLTVEDGSLLSINGPEGALIIGDHVEEFSNNTSGSGQMFVTSGGRVEIAKRSDDGVSVQIGATNIAEGEASLGTLTVSGQDSAIVTGDIVQVGKEGGDGNTTAILTIEDGGRVDAKELRVLDGGILTGDAGSVAGNTIIDAGGVLAVGASPGTMLFEDDLIISGGLLDLEVGANGFDFIDVMGDLIIEEPFAVTLRFLDDYMPKDGETFDFFGVGGSIFGDLGLASVDIFGLGPSFSSSLNLSGGLSVSISGSPSAVPLPAGGWLLLAGLGGLAALRRRTSR